MQRLFDSVTDRLRTFLYQRQSMALILRSGDGETPAILKMLETLEEECAFALFWQFPEPFFNTSDYVSVILESFKSKFDMVRMLQQKEKMEVWPELPTAISDEAQMPEERLRVLMVFARCLVPTLNGGLLVWVMFPSEIADPIAYAKLMRDLVRHEWPIPWCHHMRIIIRNDPTIAIQRSLSEAPRIEFFEPDLSTSAVNKALEEDVNDENLPLEERLQSLLLTAGTDQSHARNDLALEKYRLLFDYYSNAGNLAMTAVAMNGMGEVYRNQDNRTEAGACFEAALVAATDGAETSTPILLNVFLNLGNLRLEERRWAEAEDYYDCAQKMATILRFAEIKIMILEQLGLAQSMQSKRSEAFLSWKAGAIISKRLEKPELLEKHLSRLQEHFLASGDPRGMNELTSQLAQIERVSEN